MRSCLAKIIGFLLIVAATGGLIFSLFSLVSVWMFKPLVTQGLVNGISLIDDSLATTSNGLGVTQESLNGLVLSLQTLQSTVRTVANTVQSTQPMIDELAKLMAEDLPTTMIATQNSLNTAQESARVIDGMLSTLSRLPLIGVGYSPQVPLSTALGDVSSSMSDLPESFANMEDSLNNTNHQMDILQVDFSLMLDSIRQIETSVAQYETVLENYQVSVKLIRDQLANLEKQIPALLSLAALVLTIFLLWMAVAQIGLFTQGWEWFTQRGVDLDRKPKQDPASEIGAMEQPKQIEPVSAQPASAKPASAKLKGEALDIDSEIN